MTKAARAKLTLSLLRHAKAVREAGNEGDIARPLSARGRRNAEAMGAHIKAANVVPQLVLCSSAARTLETLNLVLPHLAGEPKVSMLDTLYLAGPLVMLKRLHAVPAKLSHVMIIGHNPGLQALALDLIAQGPQERIAALGRKMPTSGLVVMDFALENWSEVVAGTGTLTIFATPDDIE